MIVFPFQLSPYRIDHTYLPRCHKIYDDRTVFAVWSQITDISDSAVTLSGCTLLSLSFIKGISPQRCLRWQKQGQHQQQQQQHTLRTKGAEGGHFITGLN